MPGLFHYTKLKLEARESVSVREMALEEKNKEANKHEITMRQKATVRRFWERKARKNKRRRGRDKRRENRTESELSQSESVCLGWY